MSKRFPFPIPSGWFTVSWSSELEAGQVVPLKYFGTDLVLFRDEDGAAHLLDAFCPHLGAHLGHGGVVKGKNLVCPFHAWEFGGDGACAHIPYAKRKPKRADLKKWVTVEKDGLIYAWHDLEGTGPTWEVPDIPEFSSDEWSEVITRRWKINTCNQEMAENAVDAAHFQYLHGTRTMPETHAESFGPHMAATSTTSMTTPAGPVDGNIEVNCWGFGWSTTRFRGIVETLLLGSPVPIDEESCEIRFTFSVKKFGGRSITDGVGKAFVKEIARQLEQDIPIWENKVYLNKPILCDGDGPINVFRKWAKQFYPSDFKVEGWENPALVAK